MQPKPGIKTSEFIVTVFAMLMPILLPAATEKFASGTDAQGRLTESAVWIGGVIAGVQALVFTVQRGYLKRGGNDNALATQLGTVLGQVARRNDTPGGRNGVHHDPTGGDGTDSGSSAPGAGG